MDQVFAGASLPHVRKRFLNRPLPRLVNPSTPVALQALDVHDGRVVRTATVLVSSSQDKCFKLQVKGFENYLCDTWSSKRKDCPKRALSLV